MASTRTAGSSGVGCTTSPATGAAVEPQGAAKSAFDYTHLGAKGAKYFAAMVERELKAAVPGVAAEFKPEGE